ncbi:MAG TPA: SDR family oxidoreductase [Streptosporangiaceae bacterium]|jgi:NAD(P)-dependent dehydrogenase (short-subunit alcohol dehydrogenase family)
MRTVRKVAIITGASEGIEAGLVAGYRGRGWAVVASAGATGPSPDPDLLAVPADITGPAAAGRVVEAALERFGRLDTLVTTAGAAAARPFTGYTAADYAAVTDGGLAGFFWLTQRAIGEMAARYGGHVVTVTAVTAGAAGAATRSLAFEYASRGIRVNAVCPGVIQAPLDPAGGFGGPAGWLPPLGRAGQVSDVVDGVLFLESAGYITGEILHVDGGHSAGCSGPLD